MRQHLSVLMLAARSTIYKVLALLVAMAVAEGLLFQTTLQKALAGEPLGLEQVISQSRIALVCGLGFLLLCALLSVAGSESRGGKLGYTLRRLSVSERGVFLWWASYNVACFFLFWVAQLAIAMLLCRLYLSRMDPAYISGQTVFLAFYRSRFLHSLLPLAEASRYARNGVLVLCLGVCAACSSWRQRRGQRGIAVVALAAITAVSFPQAMGSFGSDLLLVLIAIGTATSALAGVWKERGDEHAA